MWRKLADKLEEEVLDKYKVEVSKRGACKGRREPSEWRMVHRVKTYQPWFREYDLQVKKGIQESKNRKKGDEAAAKNEGQGRYDKEKSKQKAEWTRTTAGAKRIVESR